MHRRRSVVGHGHLDVVVPRQRPGHRADPRAQRRARTLTELSINGNKGFKAYDANACSVYVAKGGDVITWSVQTVNPGHAARSVLDHRDARPAQPGHE